MIARLLIFTCLILVAPLARASDEIDVVVGYLERIVPPPPVLSNLEGVPDDEGLAGAQLGLADNITTGRFLNHAYRFEKRIVDEGEDFIKAATELLATTSLLVINAPSSDLLALADLPQAQDAVLLNASSPDISLRDKNCRGNLFHTIPSRAMLADALSQFAVRKKWTKWVMIAGARQGDQAFAAALKKSAAKFRIDLRANKTWNFDADMRRSASSEVPLFTQDFPDHDLLVLADEPGDFSRYVPYHTWLPRPIAGSEGLTPTGWSAAVEQHGAAQLQSRFKESAKRDMRPIDYAAWAGIRAIGEAVTRTGSADPKLLRNYMLSDKFQLAGFKGRRLTFRNWNGQLRQPIPLSHSRAVAALAPLEGFLHQHNELDTLGLDKPESSCRNFKE